jgi:hypothetical protein
MDELEYWTQQIKKGRINRREFMGRAAAALQPWRRPAVEGGREEGRFAKFG